MNESSVTRDYKHYLEKNPPKETECYEFKIVNMAKVKSFAFSRVAPHQIHGLNSSLDGLWLKIPDMSAINGFSAQKPFDTVWIKSNKSFIVIIFYMPRKFKKAVKIPIKEFNGLVEEWDRKSIRLEELEDIGYETVLL